MFTIITGLTAKYIKSLEDLREADNRLVQKQDELIAAYQKVIDAQDRMITSLESTIAIQQIQLSIRNTPDHMKRGAQGSGVENS